MLTAHRYQYLLRLVSRMEVMGMPVNDGLLQFGDAFGGRVFGEVRLDGLNCSLFDVLRRREIRLAWPKIDNVVSFGLQPRGRRQDCGRRTKRNARDSSR